MYLSYSMSRPLALKVWFPGQHHLGTCEKHILCPTPDFQNKKLWGWVQSSYLTSPIGEADVLTFLRYWYESGITIRYICKMVYFWCTLHTLLHFYLHNNPLSQAVNAFPFYKWRKRSEKLVTKTKLKLRFFWSKFQEFPQ